MRVNLYVPDGLHARAKRELPQINMSRLLQQALISELKTKWGFAESVYGCAITPETKARIAVSAARRPT